jgi:hypothetical protein
MVHIVKFNNLHVRSYYDYFQTTNQSNYEIISDKNQI